MELQLNWLIGVVDEIKMSHVSDTTIIQHLYKSLLFEMLISTQNLNPCEMSSSEFKIGLCALCRHVVKKKKNESLCRLRSIIKMLIIT